MQHNPSVQYSEVSTLQANKVLKNTYILLSMTLLFSAGVAYAAVNMGWPMINPWLGLAVMIGLLIAIEKTKNSGMGLVLTFAFTGFIGAYAGPVVSMVTTSFSNGADIVTLALGGTGIIFLAMSGLAMTIKRDLSSMGKFLFVGLLVAFIAMIGNFFLKIPALGLAISSIFMALSAGVILWQTQKIVRGGETNYVSATVTIFVSLYNIFMSLLHILTALMGDD